MTGGATPKRRGDAFEREVACYLREHGHPYAERCYGAGRPHDVGDIDGLPGFIVECKAHRAIDLAGWTDEAVAEARNAGAGIVPVVIAKRRMRSVEESYVVMRLADFAALVADREAEP